MFIRRISLFQAELVLTSAFRLSGGRSLERLTTSLIRIESDDGCVGWGESCPWGSDYLPAFPEAVIAGLQKVAPRLIGVEADNLARVLATASRVLSGQPSVMTAVDMACHDLLGHALKVPAFTLLGGLLTERLPVPGSIPPVVGDEIAPTFHRWRAAGVKQMSTKATGDPVFDTAMVSLMLGYLIKDETLKVDANGGWRFDHAVSVARSVNDPRVQFEQPCRTYSECRAFSLRTGQPVILDEVATHVGIVAEACGDGVLGGVNVKIGRVGGLSAARTIRDSCIANDIPVHIQDTGGSDIARSAIVHLPHGVPERLLLGIWDCTDCLETELGDGGVLEDGGTRFASAGPGLGVVPRQEAVGNPVAEFS